MAIDPVSFAGNRLRFFGLGSGLDIDAIVSQLMTVARIPLDQLEQRRQLLVWQKEDYLAINRMLDELRAAVSPLKLTSTFQARVASSSNPSVVTATAASGTPEAVHTLTVHQLARGIQIASSGPITRSNPADRTNLWTQFSIDPTQNPTLSFTLQVQDSLGTRSRTFSFSYANGDDINDVVTAINNANLGVTASYGATLDRLFVTSTDTGARVSLQVSGDTAIKDAAGNLTGETFWASLLRLPSTAQGQDALFDLDGATGLAEPTNQFTVAGVTYSLKAPGGPVTVTVSQDTDTMVQTIRTFVDKYNAVLDAINGELSEKRLYDYPPLTDAQKKEMSQSEIDEWQAKARQGLLQGDSLLISIVSKLRMDATSRVNGTGSTYNTLASIGISTGSYTERGRLYLDESKLRAALTADPQGVAALFTASGVGWDAEGVAVRVGKTLDQSIDRIRARAGLAGVEVDGSGLGQQIALIDEQIDRLEDQLKVLEDRYYRQFSLMEQVLAQLGSQAMWLGQQFGAKA